MFKNLKAAGLGRERQITSKIGDKKVEGNMPSKIPTNDVQQEATIMAQEATAHGHTEHTEHTVHATRTHKTNPEDFGAIVGQWDRIAKDMAEINERARYAELNKRARYTLGQQAKSAAKTAGVIAVGVAAGVGIAVGVAAIFAPKEVVSVDVLPLPVAKK